MMRIGKTKYATKEGGGHERQGHHREACEGQEGEIHQKIPLPPCLGDRNPWKIQGEALLLQAGQTGVVEASADN